LPQVSLECEIERAWTRANDLLRNENPDLVEAVGLVAVLRGCASRLKEKGLAGERELLWLVTRLEALHEGPCKMPYMPD
jgi:hypothetical protein